MNKTKLTAIVPVKSIKQAIVDIENNSKLIDCIELRLDYLQVFSIEEVKLFLQAINIPYIITLRSKKQGGNFNGTELERICLLKQLMLLEPVYIDLEADLGAEQITEIAQLSPKTRIICSQHNFNDNPDDLYELFDEMLHPDVSVYKLITMANNSLDSLRMLKFIKDIATKHSVVGHCMGESGMFSRVAGAVVGNYFTYAALSEGDSVVPDQISLLDFHNIFKIHVKNYHTKLFALIGDPIARSLGDVFHNQYFHEHQLNALYVKIKITKDELPEFFASIKAVLFFGFSVTMPLKQAVLPFVDSVNKLSAVNTIKVCENGNTAINTDGIGAVAALEKNISIKGKNILVVGAGGAAMAIIETLVTMHIQPVVANRSLEKAIAIVKQTGGTAMELLTRCDTSFDVVINTLPESAFTDTKLTDWYLALSLNKNSILMNINYNQQDPALAVVAKKRGQTYIDGKQMFECQALAQLDYWFS